MPSYICHRCKFNTRLIANFRRHLTRKFVCEPTNKDIPIKSIAESYGIDIFSTETPSVIPTVKLNRGLTVNRQPNTIIANTPIYSKNIRNVNPQYKCIHCSKTFTTRQGKHKHKKHCKLTKNINKRTYTQDEIEKIKQDADKKAEQKIKVLQAND